MAATETPEQLISIGARFLRVPGSDILVAPDQIWGLGQVDDDRVRVTIQQARDLAEKLALPVE